MAPWWPQSVAAAFVQDVLTSDAAVIAQLASDEDIHVDLKPIEDDPPRRHLTHAFTGEFGSTAKPQRSAIAMVGMYWAITGWEPRPSRQVLMPLMKAVMGAMIGDDTRGLTRGYTFDGMSFIVHTDYSGPEPVPVEYDPLGAWAPERGRFTVSVSPRT